MTRLGVAPQEAWARARLTPPARAHYPWPSPVVP